MNQFITQAAASPPAMPANIPRTTLFCFPISMPLVVDRCGRKQERESSRQSNPAMAVYVTISRRHFMQASLSIEELNQRFAIAGVANITAGNGGVARGNVNNP